MNYAFIGFSSEVAFSSNEVVMLRVDLEELLCLTVGCVCVVVWFFTLNVLCFGSFVDRCFFSTCCSTVLFQLR